MKAILSPKPERPKVIYISHQIGGNVTANLEHIEDIARELNLSKENVIPFAPYFLSAHCLDDDKINERARGIRNNVFWLESGMIDEVHLYGDRISPGMVEEVKLARLLKIPVVAKTPGTENDLKPILN